jgi:hypothetical protein
MALICASIRSTLSVTTLALAPRTVPSASCSEIADGSMTGWSPFRADQVSLAPTSI